MRKLETLIWKKSLVAGEELTSRGMEGEKVDEEKKAPREEGVWE